jgi:Tfp pilus assembly protein PilV
MEEQTNQAKGNSSKVGLAIIGLIVIAFIGIVAYQSTQNQTQNQTQSTAQSTPAVTSGNAAGTSEEAQPSSAEAQASPYKDGTYTAVGNYTSPGGQEELGVTLTLASGVVVDSQVEVKATRPISKERQEDFAENYQSQVVGKSIDEISLGKISGSSLSPKGFNDAVEKVKTQAQS